MEELEAFKSRHNLRPVEMGKLFGVSPETIHAWLSGRVQATASTVRLLDIYLRLESASPLTLEMFIAESRVPLKPVGPKPGRDYAPRHRRKTGKREKPKSETLGYSLSEIMGMDDFWNR